MTIDRVVPAVCLGIGCVCQLLIFVASVLCFDFVTNDGSVRVSSDARWSS